MLEGCTREESIAIIASKVIGDDPLGFFQRHALAVNQALRRVWSCQEGRGRAFRSLTRERSGEVLRLGVGQSMNAICARIRSVSGTL
jgi:hypothetical protein